MSTLKTFLNQPTNLRKLVDKLEWDEDAFEDAVREQPRLYLEASRYRALKARRQARAKFALTNTVAEKKLILRGRKDRAGRKQLTESAVTESAALTEDVKDAQKNLDDAYVQEELAKAIMEAYRQRGQMLKIIADIRSSEVASEIRSVRENLARDEMHKLSDRTREQLAKRKKHPLAGRPEYRDDRGRLPHADFCRSNKGGACTCGRGY